MRNLPLSRDEAEYLVDLLDAQGELLAKIIADDLRELFGMVTREQEQKLKQERGLS